jgi:tripeptidyl-peptidase II
MRAELNARVKLLEGHADAYEDVGPMVHCVVWHDGDAWRAAVEVEELFGDEAGKGLLADFSPMTNFR